MPPALAEIAARVHTVNPVTGLSTDFLNQYNELSMLLDLAADDPDMLEEVEDWIPRSYRDHFAASGFKDWSLVVDAYDLCPAPIRDEFDEAISALDSVATQGIKFLLKGSAPGVAAPATAIHALAAEIQGAIVHAGGLINGGNTLGSQAQVDTLFARAQAELAETAKTPDRTSVADQAQTNSSAAADPTDASAATPAPSAAEDELLDQDAIDALFD